jgi:hypothetical protein
MTSTTTPAARRPRQIPLVPIALIVAAFFVGMFGASRLSTMQPSHTVAWQPATGPAAHAFHPVAAAAADAVNVEVQWPVCVEIGDRSWLRPEVSYTPWSVTITLHTTDTYAERCLKPSAEGSPRIGYYLSPLHFQVPLSEPLGDRSLFDGSTSPATERYRP